MSFTDIDAAELAAYKKYIKYDHETVEEYKQAKEALFAELEAAKVAREEIERKRVEVEKQNRDEWSSYRDKIKIRDLEDWNTFCGCD